MPIARWTIAETPQFIRDAEALGLSEDERRSIIDRIAAEPTTGDEIRGSGGMRKVRFAGRGKGKSGGYRVLSVHLGPDAPTYLLAILSKGERGNFSPREIAAMRAFVERIRTFWRA